VVLNTKLFQQTAPEVFVGENRRENEVSAHCDDDYDDDDVSVRQ